MDRLVALRIANPNTASTARSSASPTSRIGYKPFVKAGGTAGRTLDFEYDQLAMTVPSSANKKETKARKRYD